MSPVPEKEFTEAEVAKHNTAEDCWLIIGNENTGKLYANNFLQVETGSLVALVVYGRIQWWKSYGHCLVTQLKLDEYMHHFHFIFVTASWPNFVSTNLTYIC